LGLTHVHVDPSFYFLPLQGETMQYTTYLEMAMGTRYLKSGVVLLYYGMSLGQFFYP
jgi:hypothetical protein